MISKGGEVFGWVHCSIFTWKNIFKQCFQEYIFHILMSFKEKIVFMQSMFVIIKKGKIVELRVSCCCFDDSKCWYIFILCEKYFYCWKVTIYVFISVNIFTKVTCSTLCLNTFKLMISNYIFYLRLIKYQKKIYGWKVTTMFLHQFVFSSK